MNKCINAEKLIAEIERRLNIVEPYKDTFESAAACRQELIWIKDFISALQQEQEPAEWGKEDEKMVLFYEADYNNQIGDMSMIDVIDMRLQFKNWLVNRLKSLRPQPHSKPSKEQMEALMYATGEGGTYNKEALKSLLNDLKKRM